MHTLLHCHLQRIPHLALRIAEHSHRAQRNAEGLAALGARVTYPGLPSHPHHELLRRLANPGYGFGGMLTVELPTLTAAKMVRCRAEWRKLQSSVPLPHSHASLVSSSADPTVRQSC